MQTTITEALAEIATIDKRIPGDKLLQPRYSPAPAFESEA